MSGRPFNGLVFPSLLKPMPAHLTSEHSLLARSSAAPGSQVPVLRTNGSVIRSSQRFASSPAGPVERCDRLTQSLVFRPSAESAAQSYQGYGSARRLSRQKARTDVSPRDTEAQDDVAIAWPSDVCQTAPSQVSPEAWQSVFRIRLASVSTPSSGVWRRRSSMQSRRGPSHCVGSTPHPA